MCTNSLHGVIAAYLNSSMIIIDDVQLIRSGTHKYVQGWNGYRAILELVFWLNTDLPYTKMDILENLITHGVAASTLSPLLFVCNMRNTVDVMHRINIYNIETTHGIHHTIDS